MAILPLVPGLEVKILADGLPLVEHQDEDEEVDPRAKAVTKYVECQAGSCFSIQTEFSPNFLYAATDTMVSEISVDGKFTESTARNWKHSKVTPVSTQKGPKFGENGSWKQRQYQFADLPISQYCGESLEAPLIESRRGERQCCFVEDTQRVGNYHGAVLSRCHVRNHSVQP